MHPRLDPDSRYGLHLTLFAVAVVLLAVPFALLLAQVLRGGPITRLDADVAAAAHDAAIRSDAVAAVSRAVTTLGSPVLLYAAGSLVTAYLLRRGLTRLALYVALTGLLGGLVNTGIKLLVGRPRPVFDVELAGALGNSFPSGHAFGSTVFYGATLLAFLPAIPRRARRAAIAGTVLLVLAISASRVTLGVHFPSDVVAGTLLGTAWLAASTAAFRIWRTARGAPDAPLTDGAEPEAGSVLSGST